jgi:glycosyltransferase involved in cell wall biosynthesis
MISRLISDKGVYEYIDAVRKLKAEGVNARFQILGAKDPKHRRGIKLKVIDQWIRSGTVEYLGTTTDVRTYLRDADCVVLPSYREGTPRTLLEAASSARPIIATDVPGCRNVVQHGRNGYLCGLRDADDLALKMKEMASLDDHSLISMGQRGRMLAEAEFDESRVIEKYLTELRTLRKAS